MILSNLRSCARSMKLFMSAVVSKTRSSGVSNILGGASVIISSRRDAEYGFDQHGGTGNVET